MSIIDAVVDKISNNSVSSAPLHAGEVYGLWEELGERYGTLKKTKLFYEFINDLDFKAIVNKGITVLQNQINELETIMENHNIQTPERPPEKMAIPTNMTAITDEFIYNEIVNGSQRLIDTHTRVFRGSYNDNIRQLLKKFIIKELDVYDGLIKYGRIKGWLNNPPSPNNQ